jgi:hypothetical protein
VSLQPSLGARSSTFRASPSSAIPIAQSAHSKGTPQSSRPAISFKVQRWSATPAAIADLALLRRRRVKVGEFKPEYSRERACSSSNRLLDLLRWSWLSGMKLQLCITGAPSPLTAYSIPTPLFSARTVDPVLEGTSSYAHFFLFDFFTGPNFLWAFLSQVLRALPCFLWHALSTLRSFCARARALTFGQPVAVILVTCLSTAPFWAVMTVGIARVCPQRSHLELPVLAASTE